MPMLLRDGGGSGGREIMGLALRIEPADIRALSRSAKAWIVDGIAEHQHYIYAGGIDTPMRLSHFMPQTAHESAHFTTTREFASGAAYEGRKDLGNVKVGDGRRYRGHGLMQTTGRANHREATIDIRTIVPNCPDFEAEPEKLEEFPWALLSAVSYWRRHNLNRFADADDIIGLTKAINGGTNGLAERKAYTAKAKAIWLPNARIGPSDQPTLRRAATGSAVLRLQSSLTEAGYRLTADGDFGVYTERAVKAFQKAQGLTVDGIVGPRTWALLAVVARDAA